jgi:hypothetical protein
MQKLGASAGLLLALAGCATSAAGIGKGKVEKTWTSQKEPQQVAGCLASRLNGSNPTFQDENGHYVVARNNGWGVPIVRYDVFKEGAATKIELRSSFSVGRGSDKLESCL